MDTDQNPVERIEPGHIAERCILGELMGQRGGGYPFGIEADGAEHREQQDGAVDAVTVAVGPDTVRGRRLAQGQGERIGAGIADTLRHRVTDGADALEERPRIGGNVASEGGEFVAGFGDRYPQSGLQPAAILLTVTVAEQPTATGQPCRRLSGFAGCRGDALGAPGRGVATICDRVTAIPMGCGGGFSDASGDASGRREAHDAFAHRVL